MHRGVHFELLAFAARPVLEKKEVRLLRVLPMVLVEGSFVVVAEGEVNVRTF